MELIGAQACAARARRSLGRQDPPLFVAPRTKRSLAADGCLLLLPNAGSPPLPLPSFRICSIVGFENGEIGGGCAWCQIGSGGCVQVE